MGVRLRKLGKKGNYFAVFYDARRRPKEKSYPLRTSRKDVAMRRYLRVADKVERGELDPWNPEGHEDHLTLQEAADRFLAARSHLRTKTIEAYRTALGGLMARTPPDLMLVALQPRDVKAYVLADGIASATKHHRFRHLRTFFNWAVEKKWLDRSPLEGVKPPRQEKKVTEFLTPSQLERLLATIDADVESKGGLVLSGQVVWIKDVILVAVCTGLRRGELCNLRWSDVDFENGFVHVRNREGFRTKSGDERSVPLTGDALAVLKRLADERDDDLGDPVFRSAKGGPIDPQYTSKKFKHYVRMARLPESIHFHSLRHTCASWLVQRGVSLPIVQAILGHSSIQVTQRYAHMAPDVLQAAMQQAFGDGT